MPTYKKQSSLEISYSGKISKFLHPTLNLLNFSKFVAKITYSYKFYENMIRNKIFGQFFHFLEMTKVPLKMSLRKRLPKIELFL